MKVLVYEDINKTSRYIYDIPNNILLENLKTDNGLLEAISTHNSMNCVRLFFDIDEYNIDTDPLDKALDTLCRYFKCNKNDWAIGSCNREDKLSYHITSKLYYTTIKTLREITKILHSQHNIFDYRMLYCAITDSDECIYYRLPNQTKKTINKIAPPIQVLKGDLIDFFVSDVSGLSFFKKE